MKKTTFPPPQYYKEMAKMEANVTRYDTKILNAHANDSALIDYYSQMREQQILHMYDMERRFDPTSHTVPVTQSAFGMGFMALQTVTPLPPPRSLRWRDTPIADSPKSPSTPTN